MTINCVRGLSQFYPYNHIACRQTRYHNTRFSYEVTSVIQSHGGYVLKYVGDAVIGFYPSNLDRIIACMNSVKCTRSTLSMIKNGINPILKDVYFALEPTLKKSL